METLNIFGLSPQDASAAFFLRHLKEIREEISERYSVETGIEQLCTDDWDEGDCFAGAPWLLDSNGDGRLELVQLLEPPAGTEGPKPEPYRHFVKGSAAAARTAAAASIPSRRGPTPPGPRSCSSTVRTTAVSSCSRPSPAPAPPRPPDPSPLSRSPAPV